METGRGAASGKLARMLGLVVLGGALMAGCPETPPEPIIDAEVVRRDAFSLDADLDADVDADVDASALGLDAFRLFTDGGPDDAGPIPQCEGVPPPAMPCSNDDECRTAGLSYCRLPIVGNTCGPCMGLLNECETDLDCVALATTDAGADLFEDAAFEDAGDDAAVEDAGVPGPDAGGVRDTCVTYGPSCACPRRVCEPRCVGAACPGSQCDTDGYVCPTNSVCSPGAA